MYNSPNAVLKGIKTIFAKRLSEAGPAVTDSFVEKVTSGAAYEDYLFFDTMPAIREYIDNLDQSKLKDYNYQIRQKPWQFSILANRFTMRHAKDNKTLGALTQQINSGVQNWAGFSDDLVNDLLTANGTAFDGSTFFATTHNINSQEAISNLYTGTGVTLALLEADLAGARNVMYGYRDANGKPFNKAPKFQVFIPTHLHDKFLTLRNSQDIYDGSGNKTNIYNQSFDIVLNHYQATSNNDWYLINTNSPVKPFIYQEDSSGILWDMVDDIRKIHIDYISTAEMNAGYGNFTSIVKINN